MLNKKEQEFIQQNINRLSLEELSKSLNIRPKKLKKEIKRLNLTPVHKESLPPKISAYKPVSLCSKNRKKILGTALFIFFITFLVYANTLKNDFIWDDEYLILRNSQIKSFSHFWNVFRTYVGYGSDNINNFYRPMQELSNMVDYFLWGNDPMGFHLTNVLLHSCAAVLVFIFIFYLCNNIPVAALSGVFFGIHPIHTEAVAYIAGRADSLYSVFFLLSFIFFIRYVNNLFRGSKKFVLLVLSNLFFILALLSKEVGLILSLLIILYTYVMLKGTTPTNTYNRVKYLWISYVAIVSVYVFLRFTVLNFFKVAPSTKLSIIPIPNRIFTFFKTVLVYFKLLFFPVDLHMERTIKVTKLLTEPNSLISFLVVVGIIGSGIILYRKHRLVSFFIFWFFVNLLPVSNIFPINSFIAEHWLYMPSVGYFFIVAATIHAVYTKSKQNFLRILIPLFAVILLIPYFFLTIRKNRDWKDEITFFENTLRYSPKNTRIYINLGNTYFEKRQFDQAIEQYEKAISIEKNYAVAYSNMGAVYIMKGDSAKAEEYLKKALEIDDNHPIAHYSLGSIYYKTGRMKDAINELEISIKQLPQYYQSRNLLGKIYLEQGNKERAIELFQKSLQIMPNQPRIKRLLESALR